MTLASHHSVYLDGSSKLTQGLWRIYPEIDLVQKVGLKYIWGAINLVGPSILENNGFIRQIKKFSKLYSFDLTNNGLF